MFNRTLSIAFLFFQLLMHGIPGVNLQVERFRSASSSYIEVSMYIVGSSLKCVPAEEYGVTYMIMIRDVNANVVAGDRFRLSNKGCPRKDLIDVKRFALQDGKYTVDVEMNDILDPLNDLSIRQAIVI